MTDATELDEAAISARVEAATEGPWLQETYRDGELLPDGTGGMDDYESLGRGVFALDAEGYCRMEINCTSVADAEFIAHARTDLPAALDEITRLRAALDEARALDRVAQAVAQVTPCSCSAQRARAEAAEKERDVALGEMERLTTERDAGRRAGQAPSFAAFVERTAQHALARAEAAESALAAGRVLARSWSGRHDLLMTGDSAAHDIEAALATPTTTDGDAVTTEGETA